MSDLCARGPAHTPLAIRFSFDGSQQALTTRVPQCSQVGVYSHDGAQLLGTGLSGPVRVLANNDVPTGAAYINLDVPILCAPDPAALPLVA